MNTNARTKKSTLGMLAAQLTLAAGMMIATQSSAHALGVNNECPMRPGFLVFIDRGPNMTPGRCGGVEGSNRAWSDFGWANRADEFRNDGRTHSVCIYEFKNYNEGMSFFPDNHLLRKGEFFEWYDEVESNKWTTGGC